MLYKQELQRERVSTRRAGGMKDSSTHGQALPINLMD